MKQDVHQKQIEKIILDLQKNNDGTHLDLVIPSYATKRMQSYIAIRFDLNLMIEWIKKLRVERDEFIARSLFYSIVISYGRIFTKSKSGFSSLDKRVFNANTTLEEIHDDLIDRRNHFVAHKELSSDEVSFTYLKLEIATLRISVQTVFGKRAVPTIEELNSYFRIVNFLLEHVEIKLQHLADGIWKHLREKFTAEQLSYMKMAGPTIKNTST